MTENKRFKLKIIGDINDVDSEIILKDGGQPLAEFISIEDARLVRDLLNALNDENEQLKQRVKQLEDNILTKLKIICGEPND